MTQRVLLQSLPSAEVRAVRHACLLDGISLTSAPIDALDEFRDGLASGRLMPVGSVEFVRAAMQVAKLHEPPSESYPAALKALLHRPVKLGRVSDLASEEEAVFIKPATTTKLFSGFIWRPGLDPADLGEHEREQTQALSSLPVDTAIWICPPVEFLSEVRYYVIDSQIAGQGRYDPDGADDAPLPARHVVEDAVATLAWPYPYTLDLGVLSSGETALVETHHAWAIGLYGNALDPRTYYRMLRDYWDHLLAQRESASTHS